MRTGNLTKPTQGQVTGPRDFFEDMRDEMNRMFGSLDFGRDDWPRVLASPDGTDMIAPDLDVHETDTAITIEAELPGVDEKDVSVTVANGVLTVKGEKKAEREEKQKNYYVSERSFGSFARSIRLPGTVDDGKIEAHIEKGVLKITVAKRADAAPAERRIEIKKA
jgi:HSP20 family protein